VQEKSYWLGLNNFSDLSHEEFQVRYLGTRPRLVGDRKLRRKTIQEGFIYADVEAPASVDWREKGAVAEVKDQGSCGESFLLVFFLRVPVLSNDFLKKLFKTKPHLVLLSLFVSYV
jgi:hypothetical protein